MSNTLHIATGHHADPFGLAQQLPGYTAADTLAMIATPQNFHFCRLDSQPASLADCYEITLFCAQWELHAVRNGAAFDVCIKSEQALTSPIESKPETCHHTMHRSYLLWGDINPPVEDGVVHLQSARIGTLYVPAPDGRGMKLALTAIEYFKRGPYGNAMAVGQRLTGLSWANGV